MDPTDHLLDEHLAALRDARASRQDQTLSPLERQCAGKAAGEHTDAIVDLLRQ